MEFTMLREWVPEERRASSNPITQRRLAEERGETTTLQLDLGDLQRALAQLGSEAKHANLSSADQDSLHELEQLVSDFLARKCTRGCHGAAAADPETAKVRRQLDELDTIVKREQLLARYGVWT